MLVHRGLHRWTSLNLSQGCMTLASDDDARCIPYGMGLKRKKTINPTFGTFRNRQNVEQQGEDYRVANRQNFLACLYGGFTAAEIDQLTITTRLVAPAADSLYARLQQAPVAFFNVTCGWDPARAHFIVFGAGVRRAKTLLRRVKGPRPLRDPNPEAAPGTLEEGSEDLLIDLDRDVTTWSPSLRIRDGERVVWEGPAPAESAQESRSATTYRLAIDSTSLAPNLQEAAHQGRLSLVLKIRYAWLMHSYQKVREQGHSMWRWVALPPSGPDYPYLPAAASNGLYWDQDEPQLEFPIPRPGGPLG